MASHSASVVSTSDSQELSQKPLAPLNVTAVYAGSFDPFTLGHKDIAARAGRIYSQVVIAIGINSSKIGMFSPEERKLLIEEELKNVQGNFRVEIFTGLLAHYAVSKGAQVLIRGVRGLADIPGETQLAAVNREQSGQQDLDTVFMPARKDLEDVSSSATKELIRNGGDVRNYVSRRVELAMRTKLQDGDVTAFLQGYSESLIPTEIAEKIVHDRWMQLARRMRLPDESARVTGAEIIGRYKEPPRGYHNLVHIAEGLLAMESFQHEIGAFDAFQLGWLFHDFVYDPGSVEKGSNERASVSALQAVSTRLSVPPGISKRAAQFIESTIDHKTYDGDLDGALFIDNDLWILGSSTERYLRYANDIRHEYGIFDDVSWAAGRVQFLKSMLQRPRIFKTELFESTYGANVRPNIEAEIAKIVWGRVDALTGSIGSGKSSVMSELATSGVRCESADAISSELRKSGTETFERIVAHFGPSVIGADGELNRKELRNIVFSNPDERKALEAIMHPAIEALALERFTAGVLSSTAHMAYEVPLLFEAGLENRGFKRIITVDADTDIRAERVMKRDQCSREQAEAVFAAQMLAQEKARRSDVVIVNNGDLADLKREIATKLPELFTTVS